MEVYNHLLIEKKWQDFFEKNKIFKTNNKNDNKFTIKHNYLKEQFYKTDVYFKLIKKIVSFSDFTLGNFVSKFENKFWDDVESIKHTSFAHPLEKMLQGALNKLNKELLSETKKAQNEMNNKYVNKIYSPTFIANIPIEPVP